MSHTNLDFESEKNSAVVLANAAFIGGAIVREIIGNDISTTINGEGASRDLVEKLILQRVHSKLSK